MRFSRLLLLLFVVTLATTSHAATINMEDPRRALGREDDVRIDALLLADTIVPGTPVGVTFQIHNLTNAPIAIVDKVASASYDPDTRTIVLVIGSEVPQENMPHVTVIAPNEKRIFRASATPVLSAAARRGAFRVAPRFVQVKVSILRDLTPFRTIIDRQARGPQPLSDELFDRWFESNDTILLNSVPVQFKAGGNNWEAVQAENSRGTF